MNRTVTVTRSKDDDGVPIISIPIANSNKPAILYQEDFDLLLSLNIDPRWTFNANLVLERGQLPIARILFDAKAGEKVRYKDGNSLNLKRDNLLKAKGGARSNTREKLADRPKTFRLGEIIDLRYIDKKPSYEVAYNKDKLPSWEIAESLRTNKN